MNKKYFTELYMTAENAITEFRKYCNECEDVERLNTARYELETLQKYIGTALGEIALELEKFYEK